MKAEDLARIFGLRFYVTRLLFFSPVASKIFSRQSRKKSPTHFVEEPKCMEPQYLGKEGIGGDGSFNSFPFNVKNFLILD